MNKLKFSYGLLFGLSFCLIIFSKAMADTADIQTCSDHPDELYANGGVCKVHATVVQEISSPVYRAIEGCLDASVSIENNEFLVDWNIGTPRAKAHVYENDLNYWIAFNIKGDAGGGFICLVEKMKNRVVWIEAQH